MNLSELTPFFDSSHVYAGGKAMAAFIATTVTPVALVISLWLRIGSSQLDTVTSGSGKWSALARDLAIWLPVLGMYFALANLVTDLFQALYNAFHEHGSAAKMYEVFEKFLHDIESREAKGIVGALSFLASGALIIPWTLYYFSMFISSMVFIFMQLAHALAYSFALSWGLIAIPLSIGNFRLLRGWGIFTGSVLLWPMVHYMAFALFNPLFVAAGERYLSDSGGMAVLTDKMQYYLILTTINFLAAGLSLSAPFVASALVNNSGSLSGLVAPFAAAAAGAAATGAGMARSAHSGAGGGESSSGASKPSPSGDAPATPSPRGDSSASIPSASGASPDSQPSATRAPTPDSFGEDASLPQKMAGRDAAETRDPPPDERRADA